MEWLNSFWGFLGATFALSCIVTLIVMIVFCFFYKDNALKKIVDKIHIR